MSSHVDQPAPRVPGRPRSERAEQAIIDAALELLVEQGAAGTMEAIAYRAGVGKATIYRRWRCKEDLLVDAIDHVTERVPLISTPDLRADLLGMIDAARRKMTTSVAGKIMPRLMSAALDNPDLMRRYWEVAVRPRRAVLEQRLIQAVDAGELRGGLDIELLTDLLMGPIMQRKLFAAARPKPTRELAEQCIDLVLAGACPR